MGQHGSDAGFPVLAFLSGSTSQLPRGGTLEEAGDTESSGTPCRAHWVWDAFGTFKRTHAIPYQCRLVVESHQLQNLFPKWILP